MKTKKISTLFLAIVTSISFLTFLPPIKAAAYKLSPHFDSSEFLCDCGCGAETTISSELINRLEELFGLFDCSKIIVTSGYRHAKSNSQHHKGTAADVILYDKSGSIIDSRIVCCLAADIGINGVANINTNYRAVHIDVRKGSRYWGDEIYGLSSIWNQCGADGKKHNDFYEYFNLSREEVYSHVSGYNPPVPATPSKPVVKVEASDSAHPVTVSYNACDNTTDYCIRFFDESNNIVYAIGGCIDAEPYGNLAAYFDTSFSHTFPAGSYTVSVASVNWDTTLCSFSDPVSFTVTEAPQYPDKPIVKVEASDSAHPVTVSYNACDNTTDYCIRFFDESNNIVYAIGGCIDAEPYGNLAAYFDTSFSHTFPAGSYTVSVASANWDTTLCSLSDPVSFTVTEAPQYPDKPIVKVEASDSAHPVTVSYNACSNTTDYCIRYYDASDHLIYAIGDCEDSAPYNEIADYTQTSHSLILPAGTYTVKVAAVNASDKVWTYSDPVSFVVMENTSKTMRGDVNCDGAVDVSDAVLTARFCVEDHEAVITDQGKLNADVTHDGNVDAQDAAKILQYIAKKISLEDLAK